MGSCGGEMKSGCFTCCFARCFFKEMEGFIMLSLPSVGSTLCKTGVVFKQL